MTFTDMVTRVVNRMNLTSTTASTRVGETINEKYKEVLSRCGMVYGIRTTGAAQATIGNRYLTFSNAIKISAIYENSAQVVTITSVGVTATVVCPAAHGFQVNTPITIVGATPTVYNGYYVVASVVSPTSFTYTFAGGSSPATGTIIAGLAQPNRILDEQTFDELRDFLIGSEPPQAYAVSTVTDSSVTVFLDCFPTTAFVLTADIFSTTADLSGTDRPLIVENFQNMLLYAAMEVEYDKMEKPQMAVRMGAKFEKRLAEYQYFLSISGRKHFMQGQDFFDWASQIAI